MKYIMSHGAFVCRETGEEIASITGKLTGIRIVTPENGADKLQLDFSSEGENEQPVVKTLSLKKYGDASLKILRCLFGVVEILHDKVFTIELEAREGKSALIKVSADGESIPVFAYVEPFAADQMRFIDKAISALVCSMEFSADFLIITNDDGFYPLDEGGDLDAQALGDYIINLRRTGRQGELKVIKTGFTTLPGARAYQKALTDIGGVHYTTNSEKISLLWLAYAGPLPEMAAPAAPGTTGPADNAVGSEEEL